MHYKGQDSFKTRFGALLTIVTYALMTVNLVDLLIAFSNGSNQKENLQVTKRDRFETD